MKVLLCDSHIISMIGGGQRVYNKIIRSNPQIEFHAFLRPDQTLPKDLPGNVIVREWKNCSAKILPTTMYNGRLMAQWIFDAAFSATEIARQVAGETFDIADLPDYYNFGAFLRPAFNHFSVKVGKIALALHGNCSSTYALNWPDIAFSDISENISEFLQYRSVDLRYAISKRYKAEWESLAAEHTNYIDPLYFLNLPEVISSWEQKEKCNLVFLGRPEKGKGPDVFLELISQIPKELYARAMLVGPDCAFNTALSAKQHLVFEAKRFGIRLENIPKMNDTEMRELYSKRTIIFATSRKDTFNLVAMESLFAGCPTVISTGAGIVDFLKERIPNLPWVSVDPENTKPAVEPLIAVLKNYDYYRKAINTELSQLNLQAQGANLSDAYSADTNSSDKIAQLAAKWYRQFISGFSELHNAESIGLRVAGNRIARSLRKSLSIGHGSIDGLYEMISDIPEKSCETILRKLELLWQVIDTNKFDRARIWDEAGRLERMRGNLNLWATYRLRSMRAMNETRPDDIADLIESLSSIGFPREAEAVRASQFEDSALCYLENTYRNHRCLSEYEFIDKVDQRHSCVNPKISIIVSLYNAADKLGYFLQKISEQTLFSSNQIEIILVDSASPKNEKEAFQRFQAEKPLPVLYVRSRNRETIQTAWNQGISLSRAEYLCFLGVDETLRPDALSILSQELDADPSLDWLIGDSVITEVDKNGQFLRRGMIYNRSGYHQDIVQLETCYLSWVGALYRKSIHDRFGYYDGSYRAAGDTEFKNRILSRIRSKTIPETLGIFLNYPEERTTQSPVAEIEDYRAWYMHRTVAGVRYTYANRSQSELEAQIIRSLGYRKSYMDSVSTDFSYADSLLKYLESVSTTSELLKLRPGIDIIIKWYQSLEYFDGPNPVRLSIAEHQFTSILNDVQHQHELITGRKDLKYSIDADNRYQQHSWAWKDLKSFDKNKIGTRYVWL